MIKDPQLIIIAEAPGYSEIDSSKRNKKPAHCKKCALAETGKGFVHPTFPGAGRPLVGVSGRWLRYKILAPAGIDHTRVLLDNTIRCLPTGVSGGYPTGKEKIAAESHCRHFDLLEKYPNVPVMLVGSIAATQFYGRKINVSEMHGDIRVVGRRVVGITFHPAAVLREPNFWPVVTQEFYNLINASRSPQMLAPPRVIKTAPTHVQVKNGYALFDLEWKDDKVNVFGIATEPRVAFSTYDVSAGIGALNRIIEKTDALIAGHAIITADIPMIKDRLKHIPEKRLFDTMIAAHTVHPHLAQLNMLDLGSVVRYYFPTTDWKEIAIQKRKKKNEGLDLGKFSMLDYNGWDCAYPARLVHALSADLDSTNQWHIFHRTQRYAQLTAEMHDRKIKIDRDALWKYAKRRLAEQADLRKSFPINPNSWQQIIPWAKETCGIKIPDIQADTLNKHYGKNADFDRLIDYREGVKSLTSWFPIQINKKTGAIEDVDEWIAPQHHATGTNVDRPSASDPNALNFPRPNAMKSIVRNGKLQDVPNKLAELRRFIIPRDKDLQLLCPDYSQIENRAVAWEAGCQKMLDAFMTASDFHRENAANIYGKPADQITESERHFGKTVTHASGYGETKGSLAERLFGNKSAAAIAEAERLQNGYFTIYPEIPQWQQTVADMVERQEPLVNAFGRRRVIYAPDRHSGLKEGCHFLGCSDGAGVMIPAAIAIREELGLVPLLTPYDEIALEIPRGSAGLRIAKQVVGIMQRPIKEMDGMVFPAVPKIGDNYFELSKVKL